MSPAAPVSPDMFDPLLHPPCSRYLEDRPYVFEQLSIAMGCAPGFKLLGERLYDIVINLGGLGHSSVVAEEEHKDIIFVLAFPIIDLFTGHRCNSEFVCPSYRAVPKHH